jgi:hypothetical protein
MTLVKKSVMLKNFRINPDVSYFVPKKGIEVKWENIEGQTYATLIGKNKRLLQQQANELPILSDRARTLKSLPKMRVIGTKVERII